MSIFDTALNAYNRGDFATALAGFRQLAAMDHASGAFMLGRLYHQGHGVTNDYKEAEKWFRLSAEKEDVNAQFFLGSMHYYGDGVEKDYKEAEKWFRLAAEQGYIDAQHNLGVMYANGEGVEKDYKEAEKWFRLSAEKGHPDAQYSLGQMYVKGQGVTQDYKEVEKWMRLAAEQGHPEAQNHLGSLYANGQGVRRDYKEAVKWFQLAAEQGDAFAQINLGAMYQEEKGVRLDYKEAEKWFRLAAEQGHPEAGHKLSVLLDEMKHSEFAKSYFEEIESIPSSKYKEEVDYAFQNLKLFGLVQSHEIETIILDGNTTKAPARVFYSNNFNIDVFTSFSSEEYKEKMLIHILFNPQMTPGFLHACFYVIEIYPKDDSRRAFFQCVPLGKGLGDEEEDWENGVRLIHTLFIAERINRFISLLQRRDEISNLAFTKCINYYNKELAGKPIRNLSRNTSDKSKHIYESFGKKENDSDERIYYPPDIFNESS